MLIVQANHERHAKQHRGLAHQYNIGDLVWLDTKNLFTMQSSKKLKICYTGKYQVK